LPVPVAALPALPPSPPRSIPALDFAAYGDCRSDHAIHAKICAGILASNAKYVLVSGDLVDWGDDKEDWEIFRRVTRELRAKVQYLAAPGNHDTSLDRLFEREFGLDKTYREKRLGDVHVFLLDSNDYFRDEEQLRWLEERASASDARHKVAVFHHPAFGLDAYGDGEAHPIRDRIHPRLVKLRFCAAFCGHEHSFFTGLRDGVRYVVTAGGGAPLYPQDPSRARPGDLFRKFHHWVGLRFDGRSIQAQVFDPDGVEAADLAFTLCDHP
jgi:hypothetical protein